MALRFAQGQLGYEEDHGARLRAARRMFAREEAEALAETSMAELEKQETGALKEREMIEAAHGRRLGREQEFARPLQTAEIGRTEALTGLRGAQAEEAKYDTRFSKSMRPHLESMLKSKAGIGEFKEKEAGLSFEEMELAVKRRKAAEDEAEMEAARPGDTGAVPEATAKPGRELSPYLRKILFGGKLSKSGTTAAPWLAPVGGWEDWNKTFTDPVRGAFNLAFPRTK